MVVSGRSRLPVIISICFAAVAAIGTFATLAWVTGQVTIAEVNPLYVPIAPLAILCAVLLGASWFLYSVRPEYSWFRILVGAVGVIVVTLTSLIIYHIVMPGSFSIERLMFSNPVTLREYFLVEMSPIAAVMFLLGGLSLILQVSFSGTWRRTCVALFGLSIFSCGVVTSIGYLYEAPLLYGSFARPVSVLAGIGFLFLGIEVWAAAGRDCWPTRSLVGDSVQARLLRAFLPVTALTLVIFLITDVTTIMNPVFASLELLAGLVVVVLVVGRLSREIGGEIDRGIVERERLQGKLHTHLLNLEELVELRTKKFQESEAKYRELFEASPISLWEEDYSLVKQFLDELRQKGVSDFAAYFANHPTDISKCVAMVKVITVNKATLTLYDATSMDELVDDSRGIGYVFPEESHHEFVGQLVAWAQGKKHHEAETDNRTLQGETKHIKLTTTIVPGYEQSLAKVLVCIVDLTSQKKLEAELVKTQRLATIGETAAMVGHDLRNPLQGIAGALHLLKQESLTAEERREMLGVIEESVKYSDTIVRDLSEYSAEIKLKLAQATPKSITRTALEAVKVPENVRVQDLSEDQPTLRVDPDGMRRVLINLIENAIDAMPQGGTLTISSKKFDGNVEFSISDTGSGVSEKVMENLWKPLQTTKAKGMGLGLAICKRIVDAHGGNISVKSKPGEGTTMTIRLPIKLDVVEVKQK